MPLYPAVFSDTADGLVPLSGGGTTNFLRADATWAAAGGAGSNTTSFVKLEEQTASSSAQIDFGLDNYTGYQNFCIFINHALPATDLVEFQSRTSTDSGSTFDAGASDYRWTNHAYTTSAGNAAQGSAADTRMCFTDNGNDMGNVAGEAWSGQVWIYRPADAAEGRIEFSGQYKRGSDGLYFGIKGVGFRAATADITDIRFMMSSGNIASGTFALYGISSNSDGVPSVFGQKKKTEIWTDCIAFPSATGGYAGPFGIQFSGTGTQVIAATTDVGQSTHPGVMQLELGTTTTGRAAIRTNVDTLVTGGGILTFEAAVRIEDLSDATNEYDFRIGFGDSDTGDHTDGMYFEYDRNSSTNWNMVVAGTSTRTRTATATAVAADTWVTLKIVCNAAASSVAFYINGTEQSGSPLTGANIPTGFAERFGAGAWAVKSAGTTERICYVDYILAIEELTTTR